MSKDQKIGRLALREEGNMWNAYYALPDSMEGAIWLGSIAMKFVVDRPKRKAAFMDLMREALYDVVEEKYGVRPVSHGVVPAPESERSGHG